MLKTTQRSLRRIASTRFHRRYGVSSLVMPKNTFSARASAGAGRLEAASFSEVAAATTRGERTGNAGNWSTFSVLAAALAGMAGLGGTMTSARESAVEDMKIFTGNANEDLSKDICAMLGLPLGEITVGRFADGEAKIAVHENVRGKDVYIIQPTSPPVNEHLVELLLMVSTMRRASADKITCVIPYYGYARQDRKMQARVPISAADIARLLEAVGVDRVVAVDLHCGQIQGFFGPRVPVDNLQAANVGVQYFSKKDLRNIVIVSPDAGGVHRAKVFREGINASVPGADAGLAMIIKQRHRANQVGRMDLVGNVEDTDCIIVDDMIDTAGTLTAAANHLKENGARRVYAFASHGVLSGPAVERIDHSKLEEVVVVNTVPLQPNARACRKITQLSVAPLIAEAIRRVHTRQSVSALFGGSSGKEEE